MNVARCRANGQKKNQNAPLVPRAVPRILTHVFPKGVGGGAGATVHSQPERLKAKCASDTGGGGGDYAPSPAVRVGSVPCMFAPFLAPTTGQEV